MMDQIIEEIPHPDDVAIDKFAAALKAKMKRTREAGRGGWDDPKQCTADYLRHLLNDQLTFRGGDPVDVGNFVMMLFNRGERATIPQPDWEESDTLTSELWKNPFYPMQERLQIADGAVHFQDKIITNLRQQLAEAKNPVIYAMFETQSTGITGTTEAPINRINNNDDGSFTVVIDHWPE